MILVSSLHKVILISLSYKILFFLSDSKIALRSVKVKIIVPKPLKDIPFVFFVRFTVGAVDKSIIQVTNQGTIGKVSMNLIHESLEGGRSVG